MKVLMISLDQTLLDPSSRSAARIARYAEAAGEIIVIVPKCSLGKVVSFLFRPKRVDLVTAQDPFWTGTIAYLVSRRAGVPLEIQLHGDLGNESWIRRQWALWMIRRADGVRVVSERLRRRLVGFGIKADQIYKVPIGLDSPSPFPLPPCLTAGRRGERVGERVPGFETIFTYVGRLDSGKGVDLLIEAFAKVATGNRRVLFQIVGDGPERRRLEKLALRLELRTYVRFLGFMKDPRSVIAASDALVLPSWSEGWGRAPVEALSLGVPVIMTDVGLAGEVVRDNENGLVVPAGSMTEIRDALVRFAGDGNLRERLREGAHGSRDHLPKFSDTVTAVVDVWKKITVCQSRQTDSERPHRNTILFIFLLALAARLIMFGLIQARGTEFFYRFSDGNEYLIVARNLIEGRGFTVQIEPPYTPYEYYVPGYPFILAGSLVFGLGIRAVILLQVLAGAATAVIVATWGRYIVGKHAAIIAGVLLALEPTTIFWNNQLVTETFSTIYLLGALFFILKGFRSSRLRSFAASGVLLGFSILIRHAAQFFLWLFPMIILCAIRGSWRRRLAAASLCFVFTLSFMAPWIIRNRVEFGLWFYSTAGSAVGIGKTLQHYALIIHGKSVYDLYPRPTDTSPPIPADIDHGRDNIQDANYLWRAGLSILRQDPIGLARVYLSSFIPFFFGDGYVQIRTVVAGSKVPEVRFDHSNTSLWTTAVERPDAFQFMIGKIVWALLTGLAILGTASRLRVREARAAVILAIIVIAYYAIGAGIGGYSRFRFPVTPLILLLASSGIVTLAKRRTRAHSRSKRLLVVTQAVDLDHPILGFFHRWILELAGKVEKFEVVALSVGRHSLPPNVAVRAPRYRSKMLRNIEFLWLLARSIPRAGGVFFHMCPEYALAAAPFTILFRKRTLLWYTHRSLNWKLRLASHFVSGIFTASSESCRIDSEKIVVTGHGIEIAPPVSPRPSADFRLLVVGRISPIKDIGTVLEAASILRSRGIPATVTIVGGTVYPADETYALALRTRVRELGLGSFAHFAGTMKHEDLPSAYKSADVLVSASPNGPDKVVYEAVAAGLPALAAHPAFAELFGNRNPVLSFPAGDARALADRLAELWTLDRSVIGTELRATVERRYSLSHLADRIAKFFL